ncbi:MAG: C1 family peptidase, partial [Planctomycetota bacterium]
SYYWGFSLNDLALGVGYRGPAVLGISWMEGMADTDENGFIHATGSVEGGHCILCRGINVKEKYFLLRNSWGKNWGMNGDCKVSFSDMKKLLADNGEAVFFRKRHTTVS